MNDSDKHKAAIASVHANWKGVLNEAQVEALFGDVLAARREEGFVEVPREPTEAMLDATGAEDGGEWYFGEVGAARKAMLQVYRAMLNAAEQQRTGQR